MAKQVIEEPEDDGAGRRVSLTISPELDRLLKPYAALMGGDAPAIKALMEKGLHERQRATK